MALFFSSPPSLQLVKPSTSTPKLSPSPSSLSSRRFRRGFEVKACFFNPTEEPLLKEALKEPVAFLGGVFAGLLRLDLNEDPLKEWVTRTVEASGVAGDEEIDATSQGGGEEESPQQIEIE